MNEQNTGGNPGSLGPIVTFSGAHPYRPQCVVTAARSILVSDVETRPFAEMLAVVIAERITAAVDAGECPRCGDPLTPPAPPVGWKPAGTRALPCRCVPVCEVCSGWIEPVLDAGLPVTLWPTNQLETVHGTTRKEAEDALVAEVQREVQAAYLSATSGAEPVLVTAAGVTPIQGRPHPGGWLEYGYDDTDDSRERQA